MPDSQDLQLGPQQSGSTSFAREDDKSIMSFSKQPSQKQQDDNMSQKSGSAFGKKLSQFTMNTKNDNRSESRFTKIDENLSEDHESPSALQNYEIEEEQKSQI